MGIKMSNIDCCLQDIECHYCCNRISKEMLSILYTSDLMDDGDTVTIECDSCGEIFEIEVEISINYITNEVEQIEKEKIIDYPGQTFFDFN